MIVAAGLPFQPHEDDDEAQTAKPETSSAQIGHTDWGLVVLYLQATDQSVLFSPDRARQFAALLLKHADICDIDALKRAQPRLD